MKATEPGPTIGKALEGFNPSDNNTTTHTGKIQTFINVSYYEPIFQVQGTDFSTLNNLIVSGRLIANNLEVTGQTTLVNLTVTGSANFLANITVAGEIVASTNLAFDGNPNQTSNAITQKYKAGEDLYIGDVVVLDPLQIDGSVVRSNFIDDTKIIGVVTETVTQGQTVKIAVGGRVEVKVDPLAIITAGDIIASYLNGTANKTTNPIPGAVLGKATSKPVQGRIWVQVTLQH